VVGGGREGEHLGVGRGVLKGFAAVVPAGDDPPVVDDDGPDRHLALVLGSEGFVDGGPHEAFVEEVLGFHGDSLLR
jgi:hypothetical protein